MYVEPKRDCPHINQIELFPIEKFKYLPFQNLKCNLCDEKNEIWVCLTCAKAFCSRYINNHYNSHWQENKEHCVCISMLDLSVWCYNCKTAGFDDPGSYIESSKCSPYIMALSEFKFGINFVPTVENAIPELKKIAKGCVKMKYTNFIELFKNNKFKNVAFLLGAGISTSSGLPDFRSEDGIFKDISKKYNMEKPEQLFAINSFLEKPEIFYDFLKDFDLTKYKPTLSHYFMKYLVDEKKICKLIFTQNIDNLEVKAGINEENIIFAHGTVNEGHCAKCNETIDINEINEYVKNGKIKYCPKCNGPCKPKIVFYGENLPKKFHEKASELKGIDLCFVIGTSLKVKSFSYLLEFLNLDNTWIIFINKEKNVLFDETIFNKFMFIEGLCDDEIYKILCDCGWWEEFKKLYNIDYKENK